MADNDRTDTDTKIEDMKGRAKEAAGTLTGNEELEESGENDQKAADAKSKVDQVSGAVKDGIDDIKKKIG